MSEMININLDTIKMDKEKIVMKLVGQDRCEDLNDVPHIKVLDLAVMFYMFIDEENEVSYLISNELAEKWGVTTEELYELAKKNTPQILGALVEGIGETINSMVFGKDSEETKMAMMNDMFAGYPMIVLSNKRRCNGATALMYPKLLQLFYKKFNKGFHIVPFSCHELIIVNPSTEEQPDFDLEMLKNMILNVNKYELPAEEVLSDSLYYYNGTELEIA